MYWFLIPLLVGPAGARRFADQEDWEGAPIAREREGPNCYVGGLRIRLHLWVPFAYWHLIGVDLFFADMACYCRESAEGQYYEMRRRLSLVWKEASNYQSIAELDALEACSCQELLLKTRDAGDSNQNITSGLQAMVQNERVRGRPAVTNPVRPGWDWSFREAWGPFDCRGGRPMRGRSTHVSGTEINTAK
jgi:hypothetical protein